MTLKKSDYIPQKPNSDEKNEDECPFKGTFGLLWCAILMRGSGVSPMDHRFYRLYRFTCCSFPPKLVFN